jgi:hypothetical protein
MILRNGLFRYPTTQAHLICYHRFTQEYEDPAISIATGVRHGLDIRGLEKRDMVDPTDQ